MRRRHIATLLKATLLVVIVGALIQQDLLSLAPIKTAISRWPLVLGGWVCISCTTAIAIIRWHVLIRAQGIPIPLLRTIQSAFVGLFFNVFLPGSLSGDLIKGYYVVRSVPGHTATAVSSILFDRVVGLSGLITLSAIALLVGSGGTWSGTLGAPIVLAVIGVTSGVVVFYAALLGLSEERDPIFRILRHLATRFAFLRGVLKVYEGVRVYHDKRGVTLACIGASIIAHGFLVVAWICFVNAMEIDGIPIGAMFVVVPIGMLVSSIPLGPAGIGTGHAAFLAIFALLGSNRGADLFNLVLAFQFIQAALGGMVYLTVRAEAVEVEVEHG
ncbi:MAG: flippase-like domain-containing protein [Myxococcales bacterium]|nr:flippase-like domain-containing protein [Myxococcales bacterium]